jgi:uncharacterized damage-inducible protein DinB
MPAGLSLGDLMEYTAWERASWHDWLRRQGASALEISAGPHGDGRFSTVGDLVRHVFSAEKRYVERLQGQPLTEASSIPNNDIEALFQFGQQSRTELEALAANFPAQEWDSPRDFQILGYSVRATPRKIAVHILMHEIRHWAQIATMWRLQGLVAEFHDFLASPVFGGGFRRDTHA